MKLERLKPVLRGRLYGLAVLFIFGIIALPTLVYAAGPITTRVTTGPAIEMIPARLPKVTVTPQVGVDVPLGYAIDKTALRILKNTPVVATKGGVQPTLRQDPAVNAKAPAPLGPVLLTNFEGIDDGNQPDGFFHRPPDPIMAAGPNHVVTVVNSTIDIYNKTGGLLLETSMASWFTSLTPPGLPFDPKIVYDAQSGHWMIIALSSNFTSQAVYLVSVSQTTDPMGLWWNYSINSVTTFNGTAWGDYEDIAFDGDPAGSVYITSNQFTFAVGFFTTSQVIIIPKSQIYTGAALTLDKTVNLQNADGSQAFTIRPARTLSASTGEYMINSKSGGGTSLTLWKVTQTLPDPPVITRQATVDIGSYVIAPDAKQLGCASLLDTIDNRIYNAVYKNGKLYAGFTVGQNWGSGPVAAARFIVIDTTTNTALINETYGADGLSYWFPTVTVDGSDNIISVFARSGTTEYAGIRYSGRLSTDSVTQGSLLLKGGDTCITGLRWGDYFGISVDPTNNANVWIYGEWAKDVPGIGFDWDWGTWVGEVSFSGVVPPPPVTLTLTPDAASVGRGGIFGHQITAVNTRGSTQCVDYWENVKLPDGTIFPTSRELFGPVHICLNAGATKNVHMTQGVPLNAPVGAYSYNGYVGTYPTVDNSDIFSLNVSLQTGGGQPVNKNPARTWTLMENGFKK